MPKKDFSLRKPATAPAANAAREDLQQFIDGSEATLTRKTIALPEEQFIQVKIEAARRRIPAYRLWGEIVEAYFENRAK